MKSRTLKPTRLRLMLVVALVLIVALNCGVFYLAYTKLDTIADDVSKKVAEANDSQNALQELQKIQQDLETNRDVVNNAAHIAADGENYSYQDQIVNDLTTYAARAGMTITNITFSSAASAATPATAPATSPMMGMPASSAPTPSGLKTASVSLTLKNPADYKGLLNFLHYVEQNLTKIKIANVTLSKSDAGLVTTDVLNLEVYLR